MTVAPWPAKETLRLAKLQDYDILDTLPEPAYDDIVVLAAHVCQTPTALISLIDANRQWFKAKVGLDADETPLNLSFCTFTIQQPDVLVVEDTQESARFRDHPLVIGSPYIRFYAGAPLVTSDGHALGSLCVVDYRPRQLTSAQLKGLQVLSHQVMAQMELTRYAKQLKLSNERLEQRVQARTAGLTTALQRLLKTQTKLVKREAALRHSALHDPLTGLPNRSYFLQRLEQSIQLSRRKPKHLYAVLFIDLDNFKPVNDTLGHDTGDLLLQHMANKIRVLLRKSDLVARLGGDEFAILLDSVPNKEHAIVVVRRLQKQLRAPFVLDGRKVFVGASIGITFSSMGYRQPEAALRDADVAMYHAKKQVQQQLQAQLKTQIEQQRSLSNSLKSPIVIQGEAPISQAFAVFDSAMQGQEKARLTLKDELRQALVKDQFHLYYQPIFDLLAQRVIGFEVLIRWCHPRQGFLDAGEFIAIAEEIGVIQQLCKWMIQTACQQLQKWRQYPKLSGLSMHVNLSLLQVRNPQLVSLWQSSLHEHELPASAFQMEIDEEVLLSSDPTVATTLQQLKAAGFGLCVDDFGQGYSSLSRLHQLAVNMLKIDRAFVRELTRPSGVDIVKTIIDLGHSTNMAVIAEGIETADQLKAVIALGCRFGQGFWLSEARAATAVEQGLAADQ
ncbi:MAG: EAL domain-containing protein [Phormidesmis sp.]